MTRIASISVLLAAAAFAFLGASSFAARPVEWDPLALYQLAGAADVVVVGRIDEVHSSTFEVKVEQQVLGVPVGSSIDVQRFENWTCAARWSKYEAGQRVLLFLRTVKGKPYRIMGGGGEGEMPATDKDVVVRHLPVRGTAVEVHVVDGHEVRGALVDWKEYEAAILGFRERFEIGLRNGFVATVRPKGTPNEIAEYGASSEVARHLYEEARSSGVWIEPHSTAERLVPGSIPKIVARDLGLSGTARIGPGREPDRSGFQLDPWFGHAAAFIGDVDGDGIDDLAVGAPNDSYVGHFHGAVWILFMNQDGTVRARSEISEASGGLAATMSDFAKFGTAIAALGDLDADGVPDVLVGGPGHDADGDGQDRRGGVWVLFLRRDGTVARSVELCGAPELRAGGAGILFGLGESLANLGDLDGDGTLEIAIGQRVGYGSEERSVLILSLHDDARIAGVRRIRYADGFGDGHNWFGDAVVALGDIDGDGHPDLAISDTHDGDGGEIRGAVWICFLDEDLTPKGKQKISDWAGGYEGVLKDWARLGLSLAAPGDLDGDGVPDLVAGSSEAIHTLFLNRDGTVKRSVDVTEGHGGFTDAGTLGVSIALRRDGDRRQLAVGGAVEKERVLWLLDLLPDGTVAAWR